VPYVAVINCVDGVVQQPVADWLKRHLNANAEVVDTITIYGPDLVLSDESSVEQAFIDGGPCHPVVEHGYGVVLIVGHAGCAVNKASKQEHLVQIRQSVDHVALIGIHQSVLGLWVDEYGEIDIVAAVNNA
jgi:hypothetical protein